MEVYSSSFVLVHCLILGTLTAVLAEKLKFLASLCCYQVLLSCVTSDDCVTQALFTIRLTRPIPDDVAPLTHVSTYFCHGQLHGLPVSLGYSDAFK
jgi:hypothetical protein